MERKEGEVMRHKCKQNRACVNPDHLHTGSHADNARDMVEDGTGTRGQKARDNKLTDHQVIEIYKRSKAGERACDLAAEFGVCGPHVSNIKHKKKLTWITDLVDQGVK